MAVLRVNGILIVQIVMMAAQIIAQVILIGSNVFTKRSKKVTEFFNEFILMMVMYTIFCFSSWVGDAYAQVYVGYGTIVIVVMHLLINIGIILTSTTKDTIMTCRKKYALRRYRKQRKLNLQKIKADHPLLLARLKRIARESKSEESSP